MLTVVGIFLLMLFDYSKSLSNTRCFLQYVGGPSLCFTQPEPPVALSWSSAMEWCKSIGGTLPLPENQDTLYGNVLGYFGWHTETLWLGANFTCDLNNWYWTNGSRFTGTLENSTAPGNAFAYILRSGADVKLVAASSTNTAKSLCEFSHYSDLQCASGFQDSYWINGNCYVKRQDWLPWFHYRSDNCGQTFSVTIDNLRDFSRWLEDLTPFWIGLRCSWWTWYNTVTGDSYEVIEDRFLYVTDLFNGTTAQCLVSYKGSSGSVFWTNMDCNSNLPFICQYNVETTTINPGTTAYINPTFAPTLTPAPIDQNTASEITSTHFNPTPGTAISATPINPNSAPAFTSTSTPLAMSTASVSRTTTRVPTFPTYSPTSAPRVDTNSPTTASGDDTVPSSTQTATITSLSNSNINSNSEAKPTIFGLSMECVVGLGGGVTLAVTVWLTLITVYACKRPRGTNIFPE